MSAPAKFEVGDRVRFGPLGKRVCCPQMKDGETVRGTVTKVHRNESCVNVRLDGRKRTTRYSTNFLIADSRAVLGTKETLEC
jgi:ribosomal protein L35AE/L33A